MGGQGASSSILFFVILLGIFYVIIIVPENKRKKKYKEMINNLKINDEIITRGGIIGRVESIMEDFIIIISGPDNSKLKLDKNGIGSVLEKNDVMDVKTKEE